MMKAAQFFLAGMLICIASYGRAEPLDLNLLTNKDPAALAEGIYFSKNLPPSFRRALIEDVVWLAGVKSLPRSDHLATIIGSQKKTIDGIDIVAWIAGRIRVISNSDWNPWYNKAVISKIDANRPLSLYVINPGRSSIHSVMQKQNYADGSQEYYAAAHVREHFFESWRSARESEREIDGILIDDRVYLAPRDRGDSPGVVLLNSAAIEDRVLKEDNKGSVAARIFRLSLLFHEAAHHASDHATMHRPCIEAHPLEFLNMANRTPGPPVIIKQGCDSFTKSSAYYANWALWASLTEQCSTCSGELRKHLEFRALDLLGKLQLATSPEFQSLVRTSGPYDALGPDVSKMNSAFTKLMLQETIVFSKKYRADGARMASDLQKLMNVHAKAQSLGYITKGDWAAPTRLADPFSGDTVATERWVSRLRASKENPEFLMLPKCEQFKGCPKN